MGRRARAVSSRCGGMRGETSATGFVENKTRPAFKTTKGDIMVGLLCQVQVRMTYDTGSSRSNLRPKCGLRLKGAGGLPWWWRTEPSIKCIYYTEWVTTSSLVFSLLPSRPDWNFRSTFWCSKVSLWFPGYTVQDTPVPPQVSVPSTELWSCYSIVKLSPLVALKTKLPGM